MLMQLKNLNRLSPTERAAISTQANTHRTLPVAHLQAPPI
jgi:hypothetical protein